MRRPKGFSLLELMVSVSLIGIAMTILFERLSYYQEVAEKTNVEYTVKTIKRALRLRMAMLLVEGRAQEYALLAQENPMDWLEKKPDNYLGRLSNPGVGQVPAGNWYFDSANRSLVYLVAVGGHFQPDSGGQKRLRLQVSLVRNQLDSSLSNDAPQASDSVALRLLEPYVWF